MEGSSDVFSSVHVAVDVGLVKELKIELLLVVMQGDATILDKALSSLPYITSTVIPVNSQKNTYERR